MAATTQVQVIVTAQDQATKVIQGVGKSLQDVGGMSAEAKKGADVVSGAFLGIMAAGIAVSGVAVKMASDFQASMTMIQTQAGASSQEVEQMTQAVLKLAPAVGQSPKALADALFYIESAGYRGAKALDILKLAAEGAAVGHSDLTKTADALTTVMNSGIKGINNASDAMGVMNAIVGGGKMHMDDLIGALSSGILPAAKAVGISIQDLGAALDVMTNNGIPAQEAATRLRMTLSLIESPTSAAAKALSSVGLSSRKLADDMRNGGLISAVTDLNNHMTAQQAASETFVKGTKMSATQLTALGDSILATNDHLKTLQSETAKTSQQKQILADNIKITQDKLGGYTSKLGEANTVIKSLGGSTLDAVGQAQLLTKAFGGARSGTVMELLSQQTDQLKGRLENINKTSDNFAASWQKTQQDNSFAMQKLGATVNTLMVQYGTLLLPIVTQVANFLSNNLGPALSAAANFFAHNRIALIALATVLGGLFLFGLLAVGVAIWTSLIAPTIAFATLVFTVAIPAVVAFLLPFLPLILIGIALVAVFILIATHINQIKAFFAQLWSSVVAEGQKVVTWISGAFRVAVQSIGTFFKKVWEDVTQVFNAFINWIVATFGPTFNVAMKVIQLIMLVVKDIFLLAWYEIQQLMQKFGNWLHGIFAPIINVVFGLIKLYLQMQIDFWTFIWNSIVNLLTAVGNWLGNTFGPVIQTVFNFIKNLLKDIGDFFTTTWDAVTGLLSKFGGWVGSTFTGLIGGAFKWIQNALAGLYDGWTHIWNSIATFVEGIAGKILGTVKSMINSVIGFFNNIIQGANKVGSKVPGYVSIPSIPTFQTGGIIPGAIGTPVLIQAHAGETVTPVGTSRNTDGGGGDITFNVNIGLYAGSDTDKRNIAKQLYAALLQLAQSQHKTVADYMGG